VRLSLPQAWEDLGHVADVGVRVRGATAEEAAARLVLALGALLAGGGPSEPVEEARLSAPGEDATAAAVGLLREVLWRFASRRLMPCACEVHRAGPGGAEATVAFARWDPERNAEGADVKAVTWHAARLAPEGDGWVGQAVFDI
jgi:SHS2 domain-containing protein